MNYKYQKRQIFGKRLKVPKNILAKVYNCTLSFNEFIEYNLDDKIPISCLEISDRHIVLKFGIKKAKNLDWELLDKQVYYNNINFKEILMSINPSVEDLNAYLYELVKDQIKPIDYSSQMKKVYQNRLFEISKEEDDNLNYEKKRFNNGEISLEDLIRNWSLYKDKDLSYCLQNDSNNKLNITDNQLKDFMNKFENISRLLVDNTDIYQFIHEINSPKSELEKQKYIKNITDNILEKTIRKENYHRVIELSNIEYKELFKYSSMKDYLKSANGNREYDIDKIFEELKTLPQDYIFNIPIPFDVLNNPDVLIFIGTYGLKNIVDFDNECGHFFTKNNCQILKLMNAMYLHYGGNEHNPNKTIFTMNPFDENGNYVDRPYTKDKFYEAMKRMIIYGPSDWNYVDKAPDYRDMTGEFRIRNNQLFISEQAPEKLQKEFYTKNITPHLLAEHPEYIQYLTGKDLGSCFRLREIQVHRENDSYDYENLYNFILDKTDFYEAMNFIIEYRDVFDIVFDRRMANSYQYEIKFYKEDNINSIKSKINECFRKIIIEKRVAYPNNVPKDLIANYPSMFLNPDSPKELQDAFYNRKMNSEFILLNQTYKEYLKNVDLEVLFKYMPVRVINKEHKNSQINLTSAIKQTFGLNDSFDVMLSYGKYIELVFEANKLQNFKFNTNFSKDDLLNELDESILQTIIEGNIKYDENIPNHFKNNNPTLFLSQNLPQEIRNKFYNREFTLNDFNLNPELLDIFGNTNIVCGFSENIAWMIPLFKDLDNLKIANYKRLKVISAFSKIQDVALQNAFKEYVIELGNSIDLEKIEYVSKVLLRLSLSNSSEIFTFRKELASQILKSPNPIESLNKIEDLFIRNNIPTVGKIYSCFEILHPDFQGFNFDSNTISPVLKKASTMSKKIIVFSDLIKSSFGSNNRSVKNYLKNIEAGSRLYDSIKLGQIQYDLLDETQKSELTIFSRHLATLYNITKRGKKENETFTTTGDILKDIFELSKKLSLDGTLDYNLADRVIKMFCGFTGIKTLEQAKNYINQKIRIAETRNRNASSLEMVLEQGDFIKGIGDVIYLKNILQNGSVSKEYLGSNAGSDATPLDTDVSMIMESSGTVKDKFSKTAANGYGPIWFVLKNDDRFITTRDDSEVDNIKNDMSKMEVFYTGILGEGHYGIRTGFASSEINYIVMDNYDSRVGLEIAMNGFYIPVANKEGKIIFTPKDYDKLREKMSGLSYYDECNYIFSENLVTKDTYDWVSQIEQSNNEVQVKRTKINEIIKKSLEELGLHLKTNIDGDLTEGFVELIDTGSTGRGTNKPGDGDFDFMMRLDKTILSNPLKIKELKHTLLKNLGKEKSTELTGTGDFRLKGVQIDTDINVDIDITFIEKTDKVSYSTDMALQDRLATIKKTNLEKYKYVIANILFAKQLLKEAGVYKPNRGEVPQGGLGGVGIENWILQNGGSFIDAATSFIKASDGKSFEEFKANYQIWDFGDNHLAERRGQYSHDNFVANNMSEAGYYKMVQVLREYMKNYSYNQTEIISKIDTIKR